MTQREADKNIEKKNTISIKNNLTKTEMKKKEIVTITRDHQSKVEMMIAIGEITDEMKNIMMIEGFQIIIDTLINENKKSKFLELNMKEEIKILMTTETTEMEVEIEIETDKTEKRKRTVEDMIQNREGIVKHIMMIVGDKTTMIGEMNLKEVMMKEKIITGKKIEIVAENVIMYK